MAQRSLASGRRYRGILLFICFLFACVGLRLAYIQVLNRQRYADIAARRVREIPIPGHRGVIRDSRGKLLVINADSGNVSIDPSFYRLPETKVKGSSKKPVAEADLPDKDQTARTISSLLSMDYQVVREKLDKPGRHAPLKRRVPLDVVQKLETADIAGLKISYEPRRVNPMGRLGAHILGFTNSDGVGTYGLERECNKYLQRQDGVRVQEVDRKGRIIPGTLRSERDPVDGADVTLTIDSRIQQVAERELGKACSAYSAIGGTCIVLEPNTGRILAMANYPTFDPNTPVPAGMSIKTKKDREKLDYLWKAHTVTDNYEPGSTMKGITAAAAIDAGVVSLGDTFYCPAAIRIGSHKVHDVTHGQGAFGVLTLAGILAHSSNVGMSLISFRMGARTLNDYIKDFGLLTRSGIELPGEGVSWMPPLKDWNRHFTATVAFGQSISYSPLRLVMAYGAIANGGTLMKPQIIRSIDWPQTASAPARREEFKPVAVRTVIKPSTSRTMARLLGGVVTDGTGKPAKIRGYSLAGKTGSAQKVVNGRYVSGKYVASFIGFVPQNKPKAVILVTVDEPKGTHWGATAAAPVFREVARQTMWFLGVPPDNPNDMFDGGDRSTWPRTGSR